MRRLMLVIAIASLLAVPVSAPAAAWDLDPNHTAIQFKVKHMVVSNVRGNFEKFSGTVVYDEGDVTKSSADVTIDLASVNTRVAKRDDDLRSPNFFDVAKYPTMTYRSKRVEKLQDGRLRMIGDLTLHGVTREVPLDIEGPTPAIQDPQGNTRVGGQATARINRKDFGLSWNKVLEGGGLVVGDDVEITIDMEIVKKKG
ncbi:MAG: YceI family protein [Deltaproteobacteria bacterium]|nr:YceI family protein [Deltaproteobacteria bacterium]PWB67750.1 MAG: protein yceI precursor [Deltaproteobacteria bacterium]